MKTFSLGLQLNETEPDIGKLFANRLGAQHHFHMLQDDVALADVVKNLSEQLQQVQRQFQLQRAEQQATITEQQAINAEQARQIDVLTRNDVKQAQQVDRLTVKVARQEVEFKVIAALRDNGTGYCNHVSTNCM